MSAIARNAALLLIDLQKAVDDPRWGRRNNPDAERNIGKLLAHWRATARPVVHIRYESREPESTFQAGGLEFKPVAVPQSAEPVFTKPGKNAFIGTALEPWLRERGVAQLVIVGVTTNNSVEATARMAGEIGFETIVVADGTFAFDRLDYHRHPRLAEEVHAMSLANLEGEYARILDTIAVLSEAAHG